MPDIGLLLPTGLVGTTVYPYAIVIGSDEVSPTKAQLESIEFEENGDDDPGYASIRLWDTDNSQAVTIGMVVRVHDNTAGAQVFLGTVLTFDYDKAAVGRYINVRAVSASAMLDELLVPIETRPIESDQARALYLWGKYARFPLSPSGSDTVAVTNASTAASLYINLTLRQALAQLAGEAGSSTHFHVDSLGRLVWRSGSGASSSPFNVNVAVSPGGGSIAPQDLRVERDGTIKNRYYVRGANAAGSSWFQDAASVTQYGPREDYIDAPSADTFVKAQTVARLQLGKTAQPNIRASFGTDDPNSGWRADQNVTVTSPQDDLAAEVLRIVKVTTTFWRGDGKRHYKVDAGKTGARLSGIPQQTVTNNAGSQFGSMFDKGGNPIMSTDQDSTNAGFGAGVRRFITAGIYNGDFALAPPSTNVVSASNPLPYWTFTTVSGSAVTAVSQPDQSSAANRSLRMDLVAGAAGDDAYIEQVIPVNGSQGRSFVYLPAATFKTGASVNNTKVYCEAQFLTAELVATGAASTTSATTTSIGANSVRDVQPAPNGTGIVPSDAYWLRLRVGLKRDAAANGDTVTVTLHEVRVQIGGIQVTVADGSDPDTYGYGSLYQSGGNFWLQPNNGGSGGFGPRFLLDATDGDVWVQTANSGALQLSSGDATQAPFIAFRERTDPGVSFGNGAYLYARDNGAGKTQLVVVFSSGAVQVLATQP